MSSFIVYRLTAKKGFEVRDMGNHRVLFLFSVDFDIDRVAVGEPWTFDKYLVALKRIQSQSEMKGLEFDSAHFWIQVHDLPVGSLNMRVVQDIVSVAGEVVNSRADNEDYEGGNFMRVRLKVDVTKPLS